MSNSDIRVVPGPANYFSHPGSLERLSDFFSADQLSRAVWVYGERALAGAEPFLPAAFHLPDAKKIRFTGHCSERDVAALVQASGDDRAVVIGVGGGALLDTELQRFFYAIGIPMFQGYGLSEATPVISTNSPKHHWHRFGSSGKILIPLDLKILDEEGREVPRGQKGEIVVRGENVMAGYYKNEKDTQKVLDADGWLHTGDMGTMDPDGTLYIRGRSKTMILSGNGQNIYPEEIEDKLNNMYMVLESLVLDAGNGRLRALVVPDYEQADAEGVDKSELPQIMQNNLQELNAQLAAYERVSDITIYPTEFEKTPKRSIKRFLYSASLLDS